MSAYNNNRICKRCKKEYYGNNNDISRDLCISCIEDWIKFYYLYHNKFDDENSSDKSYNVFLRTAVRKVFMFR